MINLGERQRTNQAGTKGGTAVPKFFSLKVNCIYCYVCSLGCDRPSRMQVIDSGCGGGCLVFPGLLGLRCTLEAGA